MNNEQKFSGCCCSSEPSAPAYHFRESPCLEKECIYYKIAMQNPKVKAILEKAEADIKNTNDILNKVQIAIVAQTLLETIGKEGK